MRLNRVLLLAATISTMMFALVFTISCSGEDGKPGKNGENCTLEENENGEGWNVICGSEEVGVLKNNDEGTPGAPGNAGAAGKDGPSCWLVASSFSIQCSSGAGGTLDGCSVDNDKINEHLSTITCPNATVSVCSGQILTSKEFCTEEGKVEDAKKNEGTCENGKTYKKNTQYCGVAAKTETQDSPQNFCGLDVGSKIMLNKTELGERGITEAVCNNELFGRWVQTGSATSTVGDCFVSGTGVDFANQYCQYTVDYNSTTKKYEQKARASSEMCDGKTINKDKWQKQYCGWATAKATKKTQLTGVCDDYASNSFIQGSTTVLDNNAYGPNEISWNYAYCEVNFESKDSDIKAVTSKNFCEDGTTPNNGKWNWEYCGAKSAKDPKTTKQSGLCGDGEYGPHSKGYDKGYCQANRNGETAYSEDFCGDDTKSANRMNEKTWKGQYCGVTSATNDKAKVWGGICDDDDGPNKSSFGNGYCRADKTGKTYLDDEKCDDKGTLNNGAWSGEYCGYATADAEETSVMTGACDDGDGPNAAAFGAGYCRADRTGATALVKEFCGTDGKPNNGEWKGEYCGFGEGSTSNDKVLTGVCGDDSGPNQDKLGNGYCQWDLETNKTVLAYLPKDLCGDSKVNENAWKGEYCFKDNKVATCTGGYKANTEKNSTDPFSVRCTFQGDFTCSDSNLSACNAEGCADLGAGFVWVADASECRTATSAPK